MTRSVEKLFSSSAASTPRLLPVSSLCKQEGDGKTKERQQVGDERLSPLSNQQQKVSRSR